MPEKIQNNLEQIKKHRKSDAFLVGDSGFEPLTPALSRRCSKPTELISRIKDWVAKLEKY